MDEIVIAENSWTYKKKRAGVELRLWCNSAREGWSITRWRRLVAYKKRMEQRYDRSFRKTLLAFMPKVFSLLSSWQVASCSSDSWLPQAWSLLTWNLCDSYKRKTKITTWGRETDISEFGWEWNCATARQATYEVHGIGRQHESAVTARMPLANAILFVLILRKRTLFIFRDLIPDKWRESFARTVGGVSLLGGTKW